MGRTDPLACHKLKLRLAIWRVSEPLPFYQRIHVLNFASYHQMISLCACLSMTHRTTRTLSSLCRQIVTLVEGIPSSKDAKSGYEELGNILATPEYNREFLHGFKGMLRNKNMAEYHAYN